jgi:hypothetical protein
LASGLWQITGISGKKIRIYSFNREVISNIAALENRENIGRYVWSGNRTAG